MGLTLHSYGCSKNVNLNDEEKKGLNILFKNYIYINGKEETDWFNAETKQFIDSKNSVFHRAKDEIRREKGGGRKKRTRKKRRKKTRKKRKRRRKKRKTRRR